MKHIFIITIISLIVISCSKEEIRLNHLQGKWNECYDNSEFCMDGRIEYDFLGENAMYKHLTTYFHIKCLSAKDIMHLAYSERMS